MKSELAIRVNDAIAKSNHDLLYFSSQASKEKVAWMDIHIKELLYNNKKGILVDLGCGSGKHAFQAETYGLKVIGIDISHGMIEKALLNKQELNSNVKFIEGSYTNIPLKNNSVDYILFPKNIFECSYQEFSNLSVEVRRILKINGLFILTIPECFNKHLYLLNKVRYDNILGLYNNKINTPEEKNIPYPTYFWTCAFTNFILEKKFTLVNSKEIDESHTVLLIYKIKSYDKIFKKIINMLFQKKDKPIPYFS
jgi:ubiquinone/menaquinone biosynthesis C-methylase UbiE